jgi:hypothetical protein
MCEYDETICTAEGEIVLSGANFCIDCEYGSGLYKYGSACITPCPETYYADSNI